MTYKSLNINKTYGKDNNYFTKIVALLLLVCVAAGINWLVFVNKQTSDNSIQTKDYFELIENTNIQKYTNSLAENIQIKK